MLKNTHNDQTPVGRWHMDWISEKVQCDYDWPFIGNHIKAVARDSIDWSKIFSFSSCFCENEISVHKFAKRDETMNGRNNDESIDRSFDRLRWWCGFSFFFYASCCIAYGHVAHIVWARTALDLVKYEKKNNSYAPNDARPPIIRLGFSFCSFFAFIFRLGIRVHCHISAALTRLVVTILWSLFNGKKN